MPVWFEGSNEIECDIEEVKHALENPGDYYKAVTSLMPGLTSTELAEQTSDSVIIKTNEGIMKRTRISKRIEGESLAVDFDEEYQAGSKITVNSHVLDEFIKSEIGVQHRIVISDVKARGILGFFYRAFGKSSIGNALLNSAKAYFEKRNS